MRLSRSLNRRSGSSVAHWCSLVWISSTRASASSALGHDAPVFTGDLLVFRSQVCELAAPFCHVAGFPDLGLLRGLRPALEPSDDDDPARRRPGRPGGRATPGGSPVHPAPVDGGGAQLFPGSLPMSTPQSFLKASQPTQSIGVGVALSGRALLTGPHPPGSSRHWPCGGSTTDFCVRTPFRLACRTRAVW